MNIEIKATIIILVLLLALTGCDGDDESKASSENAPTSSVYAAIDVSSDVGGAIFVSAQFKQGGSNSSTYLNVSDDDRLIASLERPYSRVSVADNLFSNLRHVSNQHKIMTQVHRNWVDFLGLDIINLGRTWYKAEFIDAGIGETVYVSLYRGSHTDADNSHVQLPVAYTIDSPPAGNNALYSRSTDDIVVQWTPSGSNATVTMDVIASCENDGADSWQLELSSDTGTATVPMGTLTNLSGNCSYLIRLKKTVLGNFDARFGAGGLIRGTQMRSVAVNTTD